MLPAALGVNLRALLLAVVFLAPLAPSALAGGKCSASPGDTVSGSITHYVDGDTFDIASDRIRPWGIDATERGEFGFDEATQTLRTLTRGRTLSCLVKYLDTTKDRRCVSVCMIAGVVELSEAMLRTGWVRVHRRYVDEDLNLKARYEAAEREARDAKRGLWR